MVLENPPEQPDQAYAWLVLPTLRVHSFINYLTSDGTNTRNAGPDEARLQFGGTFAPCSISPSTARAAQSSAMQ